MRDRDLGERLPAGPAAPAGPAMPALPGAPGVLVGPALPVMGYLFYTPKVKTKERQGEESASERLDHDL